MHYLSIISPFYNSEKKCDRLLSNLSKIDDKGIEIILVDDGSTDNTINILQEFKQNSNVDVIIINQENKGPGGARNAGLKVAKGKYVWFVDSDDNIKLEALKEIEKISIKNYDFIDFNYLSSGVSSSSIDFATGAYFVNDIHREALLLNFGRIWTKVFLKDFLINNAISYPEYCIYEDNPLTMVIPLLTTSFLKSNTLAYTYYIDNHSITRDSVTPRFFDRIYTTIDGYMSARNLVNDSKNMDILKDRFNFIYMKNSTRYLFTKKPSMRWLYTYMMMKQYRRDIKEYSVNSNIQELTKTLSPKFKFYFISQWLISYMIPINSEKFFLNKRDKAWDRPYSFLYKE